MAVLLILVGAVAISVGAALVYLPAGLVVFGLLCLLGGVDASRDVVKERSEAGNGT